MPLEMGKESIRTSPHSLPTHCGSRLVFSKRETLLNSMPCMLLVVPYRAIKSQSHGAAPIWSRRMGRLRNFCEREKIFVCLGSGFSKRVRHHELFKQRSMLQFQVLSMLFSLLIIIGVVRNQAECHFK
jgi:hypothetical protein